MPNYRVELEVVTRLVYVVRDVPDADAAVLTAYGLSDVGVNLDSEQVLDVSLFDVEEV